MPYKETENFIESKRQSNRNRLNKIWEIAEDPNKIFAFLSTYRDTKTGHGNQICNCELRRNIRKYNFTFYEIICRYEDTGVKEEFFFVHSPADAVSDNPPKRLKRLTTENLTKYGLEKALIKLKDSNAYYIDLDGNLSDLGQFDRNMIGEYFTTLKNGMKFQPEMLITTRNPMSGMLKKEIRAAIEK